MDCHLYERLKNSIPCSAMPLNKNFVSLESRVKSFDECKLNVNVEELTAGGLFYVKQLNFIFCYNCGQVSLLTEEGNLSDNTIYHSKLCTIMPHQDSKVTEPVVDVYAEKANDVEPEEKNEAGSNTSCIGSIKLNDDYSESVVVTEHSEVKNNEHIEIENEYLEGNTTIGDEKDESEPKRDCILCGKVDGIKLIMLPCGHQPYCVECVGGLEECSTCNEKTLMFLPYYLHSSSKIIMSLNKKD